MRVNKNSSLHYKILKHEGASGKKPRKKTKRQTKKKPNRRNVLVLSSERKTFEQIYSKDPASFGSPKRLQTNCNLKLAKIKSYLETKPSFTKYHSIRLKFPRLKVIVKDINKFLSLDLTHVDKLADYNRNVKYLLVAVDCLSRYLE